MKSLVGYINHLGKLSQQTAICECWYCVLYILTQEVCEGEPTELNTIQVPESYSGHSRHASTTAKQCDSSPIAFYVVPCGCAVKRGLGVKLPGCSDEDSCCDANMLLE